MPVSRFLTRFDVPLLTCCELISHMTQVARLRQVDVLTEPVYADVLTPEGLMNGWTWTLNAERWALEHCLLKIWDSKFTNHPWLLHEGQDGVVVRWSCEQGKAFIEQQFEECVGVKKRKVQLVAEVEYLQRFLFIYFYFLFTNFYISFRLFVVGHRCLRPTFSSINGTMLIFKKEKIILITSISV